MPSNEDSAVRTPHLVERSLYAEHRKIHPRALHGGQFRRLKWVAMAVLLAFYWIAPWLRWDRGVGAPDQAILIDMPGRRAYFFFIEIWPQEVYYLTGILILAALTLFFASALFGRVWCGFACWQTQFTDLFIWLEEKIEGDRNARIRLDKAPWNGDKLARRAVKHLAWIVISLAFGINFVLYFQNAPSAIRDLSSGQAGVTMYAAAGVLSFMCYMLAGFAREQVCIYMCPYARFQSAMLDEHSMIVSYEAWRGEPRGPLRGKVAGRPAAELFEGRGHCVDCKMCSQVCPTGIDIRNGSQLACIGCALCVDACNSVMDRLGLPRGLISYDSNFNQMARASGSPERTKLFRPRTLIYLAIIAAVFTAMVYVLATRKAFDVNVLHERSPLYTELSGQRLRNGYTLRILNMERGDHHYRVSIEGLGGATLSIIGVNEGDAQSVELPVDSDSVGSFRMFVTAPKTAMKSKSMDLSVVVTDLGSGRSVRHANIFAGPER